MGFGDLEDDAKKHVQEEIDGKGIYISKSWDIRVVERFFKRLFGIKTDTTDLDQNALKREEKENGGQKSDS